MNNLINIADSDSFCHYGILGMHWGIRRFQPYPKGHKGGKEVGEAAKAGKSRGSKQTNSGTSQGDYDYRKDPDVVNHYKKENEAIEKYNESMIRELRKSGVSQQEIDREKKHAREFAENIRVRNNEPKDTFSKNTELKELEENLYNRLRKNGTRESSNPVNRANNTKMNDPAKKEEGKKTFDRSVDGAKERIKKSYSDAHRDLKAMNMDFKGVSKAVLKANIRHELIKGGAKIVAPLIAAAFVAGGSALSDVFNVLSSLNVPDEPLYKL